MLLITNGIRTEVRKLWVMLVIASFEVKIMLVLMLIFCLDFTLVLCAIFIIFLALIMLSFRRRCCCDL